MSACISRAGEFSEHEHDNEGEPFFCARCGAFDEQAVIDRLRAAKDAVERVQKYANRCAIMRVEPSTAGLRAALDATDHEGGTE